MDISIVISIISLFVSFGSFAVTMWATYISKRSLNHAIDIYQNTEEKDFERVRAELLIQVADNIRLLDKARIEIGTQKAYFDTESKAVRDLMRNYTNLFTDYLPKVEASISQLDAIWLELSSWSQDKGYRELMNTKALLYRCLKDDEQVYESAIYCVSVFQEKFKLAKQHMLSA